MVLGSHLCLSVDELDVSETIWLIIDPLYGVHTIVHWSTARLLRVHLLRRHQLHKPVDSHRSAHVLHLTDWPWCCVRRLDAEVATEFLWAEGAMVPVGHALILIPLLVLLLKTSIEVFFVVSEVALGLVGAGARCF